MADPVTSLRSDGSQRLATYGSLAPGRANEHQLTNLNGVWYTGEVYGTLVESGWGADLGFPGIILGRDGQAVPVHVFESADLPSHWARLDEFEVSPALLDEVEHNANLEVLAPPAPPQFDAAGDLRGFAA